MVAFKRNRARISSYPWINNLSENEIRKRLGKEVFQVGDQEKTTAYFVKTGLNRFLRRLGYEIRKV
jgi:hypothetical protein